MRHIARIVPVIAFIIGIIVAIRQLMRLEAAAGDVMLTGVYVLGGVIVLFLVLVGAGKLLGLIANRGARDDDVSVDDETS